MANFINTIDLLGDMATADAIVSRTITEFCDDVLTSTRHSAFRGCSNLISVNIPNVTSLNTDLFRECGKLASVNAPNATNVVTYAFLSCTALTSIDLPKVTTIASEAFYYCSALTSVRLPATPPTLSNVSAFNYLHGACVFYIPTGSLTAYQNATNWSLVTRTYSFVEEDR